MGNLHDYFVRLACPPYGMPPDHRDEFGPLILFIVILRYLGKWSSLWASEAGAWLLIVLFWDTVLHHFDAQVAELAGGQLTGWCDPADVLVSCVDVVAGQ